MSEYFYKQLAPENIPLFTDYLWGLRSEFDELTRKIPADKEVIQERLKETLETNTGVAIIAVDKDYNPVGLVILSLYHSWWTNEDFLNTIAFYVDPKHRASDVAPTLMRLAKGAATATNKVLYVEVLSGEDTNWRIYERIFRMYGLAKCGACFMFDPKDKDREALNLGKR